MNKAEESARKLGYWTDPLNRVEYTINDVLDAFIDGYHQAEKDLELTWEDMAFIRLVFDALEANIHLGAIKIQPMTKEYYQEVLKQFKERKMK